MTFMTSRSSWLQISFNPGDNYTVHRIYPMMDQPGMGQSDLLVGDGPTPVYLNFKPEPLYFWGNTQSLMYQAPTVVTPLTSSHYPNIQEGRDYFSNTPRPGYTPYQYPHPLTLITNAVNISDAISTNTVTTNTVVVPVLQPPSNLHVQPL